MAPFRGWAVLPVIGAGTGDEPYRPDLRGEAVDGDRFEHVIEAGAARCLVAADIADSGRLAAGTVLFEHSELAERVERIPVARRSRVVGALAQFGETERPGDDLRSLLRRTGRRVAGFEQTFDPALHLGTSRAPPTGSFVHDTFTDTELTLLENHTGETGATWAAHPTSVNTMEILSNRVANTSGAGVRVYVASGVPATAEYDVEGDFYVASLVRTMAMLGRVDAVAATYYDFGLSAGENQWQLKKSVAGSFTELGVFVQSFVVGNTYPASLSLRDAAKKGYVAGVERISSTDNVITAKGLVGIRSNNGGNPTANVHLDSITATDVGGGAAQQDITGLGDIASSAVVGTPTVAPGVREISTLGGIASSAAVGTPAVEPGLVTISELGGIVSSAAVGTPTISLGGAPQQELSQLGDIPSGAVVGSPTIAASYTLSGLGGIPSSAQVGNPSLEPSYALLGLGGIASSATIGTPSIVPGAVTLAGLGGIASSAVVGTPGVSLIILLRQSVQPTGGIVLSATATGGIVRGRGIAGGTVVWRSTGGVSRIHQTGGLSDISDTGGSARFHSTGGSSRYHKTAGVAKKHTTGGSLV